MLTDDRGFTHKTTKWPTWGLALLLLASWLTWEPKGWAGVGSEAGIAPAQSAPAKSRQRRKPRARDTDIASPEKALEEITREVDRLEAQLEKVKADHGDPERPFPVEDIKKQYEEATYLYLVEDYEKAALLFYAVLEKADRVSFPEYEKAEFLLAESLELGGNLSSALAFYERIVGYGGAHKYYDRALVKMVELYAKTGDFERFQTYYAEYLERGGGVEPTDEILYALGKTRYHRKEYQGALETFERLLDRSGDFAHLAGYYVGAIHVAQGDLEGAIAAFSDLLKRPVTTNEQREIEDLAYLALGRIYCEQGDYDKALDFYKNVMRDSSHYVDALYEIAWTYIKQEQYDQAIRTIDILLLTFPENVNVPNLKLMRGLLQKRRKEYEDALDTYQKLVAEYTSVKEELDRIMGEQGDILSYFSELIDSDLSRIESSFLIPTLTVRFATADRDMRKVIDLARDVREEQRELNESVLLLKDLEAQVRRKPAYNLLVGMRTARSDLGQVQDRILLAKERIVQVEQEYLRTAPDAQGRAEVELWIAKHGDEGLLAEQIPERQRDQSEIVDVYENQVQEVQRIAYKLENLIEDLMAQAAAIEKYIEYSRESGTLSPDVEREARFQVASEREQLQSYATQLAAVQRDLAEFDVRAFIQPSQLAAEQAFRAREERRLDRTHRALLGLRSRLRVESPTTAGLDKQYERLDSLSSQVRAFLGTLDEIEAQQLAEIRVKLGQERDVLEACGRDAREYEEESMALAETVARNSFQRIHEQFSDLILNADFGITDVYWELKEEKSNEIDENLRRRHKEIEALREKFRGLQEGDL